MEGYRELLHRKASSSLPNFPKGPNDFYVAILPHGLGVRSCKGEDLLWLKVKGDVKVGKIRVKHSKRVGTDILLVDGTEVANDETEIRALNHFGSELVVFWTVVDHGRVPLKETSAKQQNVKRGEPVKSKPVKLESVALDFEPGGEEPHLAEALLEIHSIIPATSTIALEALKRALEKLRKAHPNTLFEFGDDSSPLQVQCLDCPNTQHVLPAGEYLEPTVLWFAYHLTTEDHIRLLRRRVRLLLDLNRNLRHRYHDSGVHIPKTGTTLLPQIKCELCPKWQYKVVDGQEVPLLMSIARKHLKSSEHPTEYKEVDIKEHMAQSPVCRLAAIMSRHGKHLEQLRRRFPGSNLELREGGVSGALISCQDCYVNFHVYPPNEVDFSTTIAKVDLHFATTRHKTLAGRRAAAEKSKAPASSPLSSSMQTPTRSKKRPSPRTSLNDLLTKLRSRYPNHKFRIHEPTRSLELKVLCADCPSFSYSYSYSVLEDDISVAKATLVNHMNIHRDGKNKPLKEERKAQMSVVVLDDDSEGSPTLQKPQA